MAALLKNWLWLPLWAISIVLVLTVQTESIWLRGLIFAPALVAAALLLRLQLKRLRSHA